MKLRYIVLITFLLTSFVAEAQNQQYTISGNVIDSASSKPVEYANVAIYSLRDSVLVTGGITNEKGNFTIKLQRGGMYYLSIDFIGYAKKVVSPIKCLLNQNPNINVGKIFMSQSMQSLKAVEIVAEKPLVELSIDKKIVNVEKNLTATGGTALDVLREVPSVEVDQDGNVSLRGSENVTILIDGRPSSLVNADSKTALEQIPASSIQSVELITNPSAKYRPDGMVGIINIILQKKKGSGLNSLLSLNAGTKDKYSGSLSLNYSTDKYNIYGSYDYSNQKRCSSGENKTTYFDLFEDHIYNQKSNNNRKWLSNTFKIGADFYLTAKTTLGGVFSYSKFNTSSFENNMTWIQDTGMSINNAYNIIGNEDGDRNNYNGSLNFRHRFNKPSQELTMDLNYSANDRGNSETTKRTYLEGDLISESALLQPEWARTLSPTNGSLINAKIDYAHPFNDSTKLEVGFDGSWSNNDANSVYENFDFATENYIFDTIKSDHFLFNENIQAVYANFSTKYKKWGLSVGSRFELASTNARQFGYDDNIRSYNNWYPTGGLSYKLSRNQELQFTYSKRINRPRQRSLNPFVDYSSYPMLRTGNPYLNPEYIHSLELSYAYYSKKGTIMPSIYYKRVNDVMSRYRESVGDSVFMMSWQNYNSATSFGIEMIYTQKLFSWWNTTLNGSWYRIKIDGSNIETDITGDSYGWQARWSNQLRFPHDFDVQVSAFYNGPRFTGQATMKAFWMADFALKKSFFKQKLSLSFRVQDLLRSGEFGSTTKYSNYELTSVHKHEGRVFWLGVTYKLSGDYKQKENRKNGNNNSSEMDSDDMM